MLQLTRIAISFYEVGEDLLPSCVQMEHSNYKLVTREDVCVMRQSTDKMP